MRIDAGDVVRLIQAGAFGQLEALARAATEDDPQSGLAWKALSVALSAQGRPSLAALAEAARLLPQDAEAQLNLAQAQRGAGLLQDCIASYRRALALRPDDALLYHSLGNAQLALGQPADAAASYARTIELRPDLASAHCNLGNALRQLGRIGDALESVNRALQLDPGLAIAHANRGDLLRELGHCEQAAASCRRALELDPSLAAAHNGLGNALSDLGQHAAAAASYREALALQPQFPGAEVNLALALRQLGQDAAAEALCTAVLERLPRAAPALVLQAELASDRGDFAAAESLLCRAAQADPQSAESLAGIAYLRRLSPADAPWAARAESLARCTTPRQEIDLRFALGKYYDDLGDAPAAFGQFQRAHHLLQSLGPGHDRQRISQHVDELCARQDAPWLRRVRAARGGVPRPVFVLGMPRSGTSLAEQILATHPQVFGAGELSYWGAVSAAADDAHLAALGAQYREQLASVCAGAHCVIDKMPANFWHVGLIHAALPDARIIHLQRNPLDTCVSIYTTNFRNAYGYAHDLADLAHYYREYQRLMQHWRELLPPQALLDVPYEGLVEDVSGWSRRMVQFIGLEWDERCLAFDRNERRVLTSSKWQVRQKIHRGSVGRWRRYEPYLGALLQLAQAPG